jgi:hypothetical protein
LFPLDSGRGLSHLAFLEGLPSGPADLIYTVLPSRSREYPGAAVILRGQEFLTGSFDWRWAIRHAEGHALFDRLHGIDADVRVIGDPGEEKDEARQPGGGPSNGQSAEQAARSAATVPGQMASVNSPAASPHSPLTGRGLGTREAGPGFSRAIRACAPEVQDIAPSLVPSPQLKEVDGVR